MGKDISEIVQDRNHEIYTKASMRRRKEPSQERRKTFQFQLELETSLDMGYKEKERNQG